MASKKLFVLILVAMVLAMVTIIVLSVTGHDLLIVATMGWVSHLLSRVAAAVALGVVIALTVYALWALA